ncbi:MAG: cobalamin-binding protein [Bacillota bacterium]
MNRKIMNRKMAMLVALAVLVVAVAGFTVWRARQPQPPIATEYPLTLVDIVERQVVINGEPQRIISLSPSNTEILFALGLGSRVIGVDDFSNYPEAAASLPKVGGFAGPNLEQIAALQPDLIVADSLQWTTYGEQLTSLGVPVIVLFAGNVQHVYTGIRLVAVAANVPAAGEALVAQIQSELDAVAAALKDVSEPLRVYYEIWNDPLMTVGSGKPNQGSLIAQLITLAGGQNIFSDLQDNYPVVSSEQVIARNPQVIVFPVGPWSSAPTPEDLARRPGWSEIAAVKSGRIISIEDDLISRPGPRIGQAVRTLAELLYPDKFGK